MTYQLLLILALNYGLMYMETLLDRRLWKLGKKDKPTTTVLRTIIHILIALIFKPPVWVMVLLVCDYFSSYDFMLNLLRWEVIQRSIQGQRKRIFRLMHNWEVKEMPLPIIKPDYGVTMKQAMIDLAKATRVLVQVPEDAKEVEYRLDPLSKWRWFMLITFYHGDPRNKKRSPYDRLFDRIPPIGELLGKGVLLLSGILLYLEYA
jgi:hypothetical protein